eukprot:9467646-Pyramimonas_sp.AAC.1
MAFCGREEHLPLVLGCRVGRWVRAGAGGRRLDLDLVLYLSLRALHATGAAIRIHLGLASPAWSWFSG